MYRRRIKAVTANVIAPKEITVQALSQLSKLGESPEIIQPKAIVAP